MTKNTVPRCGVNPTSQPGSPKYCIFGAGAIGGTIAAQLARAGATVSVIARGETLAAIRKDGLRLLINGETLQTSVRVSADPAELGPQDYVIVAVKAPSLPEVASRIGPLLGPETAVVTAMNGIPWWFFANARGTLAGKRLTAVDPDGIIARAIPASRAIGCVVYMSCAVEAPSVIRHGAGRRLTRISHNETADDAITAYRSAFKAALDRDGAMCLFGVLGAEAGGLSPQVANEILSFFRRCIEDLSQRVGGPDAEARAFQVIATLEGGMMLARAYQDTTAFDHAAAGLYRDSEVPAEMSRRKLRDAR